MHHSSLTLEWHRYGRFIYSLATSLSTCNACRAPLQRTTWLTFPRYEPFPKPDKLLIVLRSYQIPFKSSASNISKVKQQWIACLPTSTASSYMQSGRLCLIKNLLMPTRMVYSLNSLMGSLAGYFLIFLHIQLTTLKSTFIISICCLANAHDLLSRVLLSTIKFLRACPCPTCLIAKNKVCDLGTKHDIHNLRARRFITLISKLTSSMPSDIMLRQFDDLVQRTATLPRQ